tara:strand:+ start:714 stop:1754 length:1041 start_codon:yes stop_codon:yes gene_type:complete
MKFKLNYKQFSDFVNLNDGVFHPLKNFVNKVEFETIVTKQKFKSSFFPFPIFFGLSKTQYNKVKNKKLLKLIYKSTNIAIVKKLEFYNIDKNFFGKKIFGVRFKHHPYFKIFCRENYIFLSFETYKKFQNYNNLKKYVKPSVFRNKIKNLKYLPGFHTRNVPHSAHQWIHNLLVNRYGSLLIQPLIGQYKKGEYKDSYILKTNEKATKILDNKNVFCLPFYSYPRYGGALEACLHAIVRKNYGCSHFWVGRDHAGYKNFFNKYQSQVFCKKKQRKLKISIVSEKEPFYCKIRKIITNKFINKKYKNSKIAVSGTKIRKILLTKKKIPKYLMSKEISRMLNYKSLIN